MAALPAPPVTAEAKRAAASLVAGCKVNLSLRITGRREDGYHTLESVFWPLPGPCDTLTVTRAAKEGLRFSCSDETLESPGNLVVKAYNAFAAATSFAPGLAVFLDKHIPYGAGLGGGSSNAAALLLYLNALAREEGAPSLDGAALGKLGARLGADVPFFFQNTPCLVRGIGDVLEPLPPDAAHRFAGLHLVLVCPKVHVATAWAFAAWDEKHPAYTLTNRVEKDSSPLVRGIRIQNDLSHVVFERYPELKKTLALLHDFDADAASMSGSGASLFGLYSDADNAGKAARFFLDTGELVFHHIL
ncbi:4-diphosphocytidyl-2-C-methyl-D-erythritol kinase [uncultured delta proteobacterium]|uniref:4-diphosphocytidyl-2-C-methyl-D-erythritol kinase n=1 Tax=uncultured delta proteobacterium TaxID=34034 RepID=A0A212J4K6_9DELT|nr:4-diphosphocytidyl-2-C-methyl-D-erythritol kinase [uncultured delta proteobacterium]